MWPDGVNNDGRSILGEARCGVPCDEIIPGSKVEEVVFADAHEEIEQLRAENPELFEEGGKPWSLYVFSSANVLSLYSPDELVRGLNLGSTGNTALLGASVGSLTLSELSVTNTAGSGVNLANGSLAA